MPFRDMYGALSATTQTCLLPSLKEHTLPYCKVGQNREKKKEFGSGYS